MEINPPAVEKKTIATVAAIVAVVLGVAGVAAHVMLILMYPTQTPYMVSVEVFWGLLFALTVIAGVSLLRGCEWSDRPLLVFWLAMAMLALVATIRGALEGTAAMKQLLPGENLSGFWYDVMAWACPLAMLAIAAGESLLLVLAAPANSRRRYWAMVAASAATVAALVVVINLIAQKDPYRKDLESLGQYGLSDRTKKILETIDEPVRLSVIYTSSNKDTRGADFRDAVVDLANEMKSQASSLHKAPVTVVNVTNDSERAAIMARLQQQSAGAAPQHKAMLEKFVSSSDKLLADLADEKAKWSAMTSKSFIGLWGIPAGVADQLDVATEDMTQLRTDVQQQMSRSVPDMNKLTASVKDALTQRVDNLEQISGILEKIAKVSPAVQANRESALKSLQDAVLAVKEMAAVLGKAGDPAPQDPAETLKKFVAAGNKADKLMTSAAKALTEIAGKDNSTLLSQCSVWGFQMQDPRTRLVTRNNLGQLYMFFARKIQSIAADAESAAANLKSESAAKYVAQAREEVADLAASVDEQLQAVTESVNLLANVDDASSAILKQAAGKKLFAEILAPLSELLSEAQKLPELKASSLSDEITGENIVLVEMGDKTEAVPFDSVWPLRYKGQMQGMREDSDKRVFNGDTAISSKLLSMSRKAPFATVYLTYVAPPPPPQYAAQMKMNKDMRPWNTIVQRLKESNFEVKEWNLNEPMPVDEPPATQGTQPSGEKPPKVLLVLPGPPQSRVMPNPYMPPQTDFTPQHVEKIRSELDAGTCALILTQATGESADPLMSYLRSDWNVDVRSDVMVFPAVADDSTPGQYRIDMQRLSWLPLNNFASEPPIGKPLRSQRVLWQSMAMCPIMAAKPSPDAKGVRAVDYKPILTVPQSREIWGLTRENLEPLAGKLMFGGRGEDFVAPNYANGDIPSPMDLAVALTCPKSESVAENRVVVTSTAVSLIDSYLQRKPQDKDGRFSDPPKANADLVTNSVYWLIGRQQYIGSGPAQIRPVTIAPEQMRIICPIVVGALPLLVLGAGGLVMLMRRK